MDYDFLTPEEIEYVLSKFELAYKGAIDYTSLGDKSEQVNVAATRNRYNVFRVEEENNLKHVKNNLRKQLQYIKIEKHKIDELIIRIIIDHLNALITRYPGLSIGHAFAEALSEKFTNMGFKSFQTMGGVLASMNEKDFIRMISMTDNRDNLVGTFLFNREVSIFNVFDLRQYVVDVAVEDLLTSFEFQYAGVGQTVTYHFDWGNGVVHDVVVYNNTLSDPMQEFDATYTAAEYIDRLYEIDKSYDDNAKPRSIHWHDDRQTFLRCAFDMDMMVELNISPSFLITSIEDALLAMGIGVSIIAAPFDSKYNILMPNAEEDDNILILELYPKPSGVNARMASINEVLKANIDEYTAPAIYVFDTIIPTLKSIRLPKLPRTTITRIPGVAELHPVVKSPLSMVVDTGNRINGGYVLNLDRYKANRLGINTELISRIANLYNVRVLDVNTDMLIIDSPLSELNKRVKTYSSYIKDVIVDMNTIELQLNPIPDNIKELFVKQLTLLEFKNIVSNLNTITFDKPDIFESMLERLESIGLNVEYVETVDNITTVGLFSAEPKLANILKDFGYELLSNDDLEFTIRKPIFTDIIDSMNVRLDYKPLDIIYAETQGGGLYDLLTSELADPRYVVNNNPVDVYYTLGISALFSFLVRNAYEILRSNNIYIDNHHIFGLCCRIAHHSIPSPYNLKGMEAYALNADEGDFEIDEELDYEPSDEEVEDNEEPEAVEEQPVEPTEEETGEAETQEEFNGAVSNNVAGLILYQRPTEELRKAAIRGLRSDVKGKVASQFMGQISKTSYNIEQKNAPIDIDAIDLELEEATITYRAMKGNTIQVNNRSNRTVSNSAVNTNVPKPQAQKLPDLRKGMSMRVLSKVPRLPASVDVGDEIITSVQKTLPFVEDLPRKIIMESSKLTLSPYAV